MTRMVLACKVFGVLLGSSLGVEVDAQADLGELGIEDVTAMTGRVHERLVDQRKLIAIRHAIVDVVIGHDVLT